MKAGIRTTLDVIPLDDTLVRGSHGRPNAAPGFEAVLLAENAPSEGVPVPCTKVRDLILGSLFD